MAVLRAPVVLFVSAPESMAVLTVAVVLLKRA
jgi:hypothetical protein